MTRQSVSYDTYLKAIREVFAQYQGIRLTVRQIYYRLVSDPFNLIPNTRSSYNSFDRILTKARECEDIDYTKIEDRSRESIANDDQFWYDTPEEFVKGCLRGLQNAYRDYDKSLWETQDVFPIIVVEKDALSAFFKNVASQYRVIVFPSRGYSSFTKVKELIDDVFDDYQDHEKVIIHFADHDPSGLDMTEDWRNRLDNYGGDDIEVRRIGLNIEQVKAYNLAPNPVKKADTRSASYIAQYGESCWELDAVPPDELQKMVEDAITPSGQSAQLWERKVNSFWKPVLWFVKGDYDGKWLGDVAKSPVNDSERTVEWEQSEEGIYDLVARFARPGFTVLDPFMGTGTVGLAAARLNCRFIGIDRWLR